MSISEHAKFIVSFFCTPEVPAAAAAPPARKLRWKNITRDQRKQCEELCGALERQGGGKGGKRPVHTEACPLHPSRRQKYIPGPAGGGSTPAQLPAKEGRFETSSADDLTSSESESD